jgi:hypothetical protein
MLTVQLGQCGNQVGEAYSVEYLTLFTRLKGPDQCVVLSQHSWEPVGLILLQRSCPQEPTGHMQQIPSFSSAMTGQQLLLTTGSGLHELCWLTWNPK